MPTAPSVRIQVSGVPPPALRNPEAGEFLERKMLNLFSILLCELHKNMQNFPAKLI